MNIVLGKCLFQFKDNILMSLPSPPYPCSKIIAFFISLLSSGFIIVELRQNVILSNLCFFIFNSCWYISCIELNKIVETLVPDELPSWLWWNGRIDEAPEFLNALALPNRRLIIDTALGESIVCLNLLLQRIQSGQAVNDLNWLRLRGWRETLAMVFDPLQRRNALENLQKIDIDIEGSQTVQGLLLAAWIADRLNWKLESRISSKKDQLKVNFLRPDKILVQVGITSLPIGKPSINPGQIVGLRLIAKANNKQKSDICVILASESGECMRLEAGGMARMELIEQVVPIQKNSLENDVARLLSSSRGNTSPLLESATPIAKEMLDLVNQAN